MDQNKTTLERAFELAGAGMPVERIRAKLNAEGYNGKQLYGRALSAQLAEIRRQAGGLMPTGPRPLQKAHRRNSS